MFKLFGFTGKKKNSARKLLKIILERGIRCIAYLVCKHEIYAIGQTMIKPTLNNSRKIIKNYVRKRPYTGFLSRTLRQV